MIHNTIPEWCKPALTRTKCLYVLFNIATFTLIIGMIMSDMLLVAADVSIAFILLSTNTYIVGTAAVAAHQSAVNIALLVCIRFAHEYVIQICIAVICVWIIVIASSPIHITMQDKDISILMVLFASSSIIVTAILLIMKATSTINPIDEILASISTVACCIAMVKMTMYRRQTKPITDDLSDMSVFEI